ncbi:MAG: lipocalin family protein, partial [Pseudomonadota bacterium]
AVDAIAGTAEVAGPGRFAIRFDSVPFVRAPYWVLWVDEGYRTAVVGVPSGRAGWILNRDPQIPEDRFNAALQVLEFNGYDTSRLIRTVHADPG